MRVSARRHQRRTYSEFAPAKSNEFQRLVYFIQLHLAGDSTVTESDMLIDSHTGRPREVDVTVRGTVAGREILLSIECRDRKRPEDVTWIEQEHAKHSRLPTSLLVLVSSSGFTDQARVVARLHGIQLVVPGQLEDDENAAREVVGKLGSLWAKRSDLTITGVEIAVKDAADPDRVINAFTLLSDDLSDEAGNVVGTLKEFADSIVRERGLGDAMRDATGEERFFTIDAPDPGFLGAEDSTVLQRLYVEADFDGEHRRGLVVGMRVTGDAVITVTEVPLKHGQFEETPFSYGEATTSSGEPISLFVSETPSGRRTILRLGAIVTSLDAGPRPHSPGV